MKQEYPEWKREKCHCHYGIVDNWGFPEECRECNGSGFIWFHEKSRVYAEYPGGRLLGKKPKGAAA